VSEPIICTVGNPVAEHGIADPGFSRRGILALAALSALLVIAAAVPALLHMVGWDLGPFGGGWRAPLAVLLLSLAINVGFGIALLRSHRSHARLELARDAHSHASLHDPMTGAANRRAFERRLGELVAAEKPRHVLLMLDLDRFKPVNDLHGHAAGDQLLREISGGLQRLVHRGDMIARLGGDEFAALLCNTTSVGAERIAVDMRDFVRRYRLDWQGERIGVGTSIGLVAIDRLGLVPAMLLEAADKALYAAKDAGRGAVMAVDNGVCGKEGPVIRRVDPETPEPVASAKSHRPEDGRQQVLLAVTMACARPAIEERRGGDRRGKCAERWLSAEPGTVGDGSGSGMTMRELLDDAAARGDGGADLARWTLAVALDAVSRADAKSTKRVGLVLPIPARAVVVAPALGHELATALALCAHSIPHLCFVLHDIARVHDDPALASFCERLQSRGVRVGFEIRNATLDTLAPLHHAPFDEVHLGSEFVRDLRPGSGGCATIETLLTLAKRGGWTLVASGVDSKEAMKQLAMLGVERFSGSALGPALPLGESLEKLVLSPVRVGQDH